MGFFRVLLALSVVMAHSRPSSFKVYFSGFGGTNAVEVFFIISGFYIAMILNRSYSTRAAFYKNRALRLYPIYFLICGFVLARALVLPKFKAELFSFPAEVLTLGAIANSTLFGTDWLMFLRWNDGRLQFGNFRDSELSLWNMLLVPQSWSLGIELTFYMLAPILCKAKSKTLLGMFVLFMSVRIFSFGNGLNVDPWTYRFFPFELPMFLVGILLFRFKRRFEFTSKFSVTSIYLIIGLSYLILPFVSKELSLGRFPQLLFLVFLTALIILFAPENLRDKKFGELSYPIYMVHALVISTCGELSLLFSNYAFLLKLLENSSAFTLLTLALTLLFSHFLNMLVQPIERMRDKNRQ